MKIESDRKMDVANAMSATLTGHKQVPRRLRPRHTYQHEHSVSSLTFNPTGEKLYTGGKGVIKIWDVNKAEKPVSEIPILKNNYIRSIKLTSDEQTMIVCGETKEILVMDIGKGVPTVLRKMETDVDFHYALAVTPDAKYCFSCFSTGDVGMWDLSSGMLVRQFTGHQDSVSCIDINPNGHTLVTGSLDKTIRVWDWNTGNCLTKYSFNSQIFTLGVCPGKESIIAAGLENSFVEVINTEPSSQGNYHLHLHESCVLSLSFAPTGDWFITGGKDKYLNVWKAPFGPGIVRTREFNSILSR
jgi:WD40 repeat protein